MFDEKTMKVFHEAFDASLPRLAPGDDRSTRRGLELLYGPDLAGTGAGFTALDIGCGNGAQTLRLAAELGCPITAVDNHGPFLDELRRRAADRVPAVPIETLCADMNGLDLGGRRFDLVWAEGSVFVMGVARALTAWRGFLKPGGALGFTELTWLRDDAPAECREFFASVYPAMSGIGGLLAVLADCGYETAGHFTLPESAWWEPFYRPLSARLDRLEPRYGDDEAAAAVLAMCRKEVEMYRKYSDYYGYVFFLARPRA